MSKCVICDTENPKFPEVDYSTGFTFCDGCLRKVRNIYHERKKKNGNVDQFSIWLHSIAQARSERKRR